MCLVGLGGDVEVDEAVEDGVDGDAHLGPGQVRAEAAPRAEAERCHAVDAAVDVDDGRCVELVFVPVGRRQHHEHFVAGGDPKPVELDVNFDGNFVTITRKGALSRMTVGKGEKRIRISSITAVQWKEPGGLVNGFFQFTVMGGNESRSRSEARPWMPSTTRTPSW
jgi:hypothetical protein